MFSAKTSKYWNIYSFLSVSFTYNFNAKKIPSLEKL